MTRTLLREVGLGGRLSRGDPGRGLVESRLHFLLGEGRSHLVLSGSSAGLLPSVPRLPPV